MKAGELDRKITIERASTTIDEYGTAQETWSPVAIMRAELVQSAVTDTTHESGALTESTLTFRTRYLAGLTPADRISYEGATYRIKRFVEIGRRRGLEIAVERLGQ